jgi:hypothetical protein
MLRAATRILAFIEFGSWRAFSRGEGIKHAPVNPSKNSNIYFHHLMDKIIDCIFKVKENFPQLGSA